MSDFCTVSSRVQMRIFWLLIISLVLNLIVAVGSIQLYSRVQNLEHKQENL